MQVIIPMSGTGQRFIKAGYKLPKSLIVLEDKPIIHHIIDLFPGETDFKFICNKDHLINTEMRNIIKEYCPTGDVIAIDSHKKGPVYAVSKIFDYIKDSDPCIVNYCDFSCYWNFNNFKKYLINENLDGCIPAYRGFHPHSLGTTNYAYIKENNKRMLEIKEKEPYTKNRMNEYASSGTYYFKKGEYIKHYFAKAMSENIEINGEYYCSLIYNFMHKDKLNIGIYELEHFMQWGTPEDVEEYKEWSKIFRSSEGDHRDLPNIGTTIIPMAGHGSRFQKEGYEIAKPLIEINNIPMVLQANSTLPKSKRNIYICKNEMLNDLKLSIKKNNSKNKNYFLSLDRTPEGQALTTSVGIQTCPKSESVNISASDHGVLYDHDKYQKIINSKLYDIIIWTKKDYIPAKKNPEMYGWISIKNDRIIDISIKKKPKNININSVIIGTFTFRNPEIFSICLESLIKRKGKINGEYYIDSLIEDAIKLKFNCITFEVDHFVCWGTPNELKTFKYWENCFNKWESHPYQRTKSIWSKCLS